MWVAPKRKPPAFDRGQVAGWKVLGRVALVETREHGRRRFGRFLTEGRFDFGEHDRRAQTVNRRRLLATRFRTGNVVRRAAEHVPEATAFRLRTDRFARLGVGVDELGGHGERAAGECAVAPHVARAVRDEGERKARLSRRGGFAVVGVDIGEAIGRRFERLGSAAVEFRDRTGGDVASEATRVVRFGLLALAFGLRRLGRAGGGFRGDPLSGRFAVVGRGLFRGGGLGRFRRFRGLGGNRRGGSRNGGGRFDRGDGRLRGGFVVGANETDGVEEVLHLALRRGFRRSRLGFRGGNSAAAPFVWLNAKNDARGFLAMLAKKFAPRMGTETATARDRTGWDLSNQALLQLAAGRPTTTLFLEHSPTTILACYNTTVLLDYYSLQLQM